MPTKVGPGGKKFSIDAQKGGKLDVGALFHFWHPDREGVEACPPEFDRKLKLLHPDLACVRPPAGASRLGLRSRCWLVWWKCPRITHPISPGWMLLVAWHNEDDACTPLPLDDRVLANIYMRDARIFGNGKQYFSRIVDEMQRDEAIKQKQQADYRGDRSDDYYEHTKIKNIGHGSKFALHHDGTIQPGRAERNWVAERMKHMIPERAHKEWLHDARRGEGKAFSRVDMEAVRRTADAKVLDELKQLASIRQLLQERRSRVSVAIRMPKVGA